MCRRTEIEIGSGKTENRQKGWVGQEIRPIGKEPRERRVGRERQKIEMRRNYQAEMGGVDR